MGLIANEIDQCLSDHLINSIQRVSEARADVIVKQICLTFNIERTKDLGGPARTWVQLMSNNTIAFLEGNNPKGWSKASSLISYPAYLFFEQHQDNVVYECQNASDINLLLSETSGFEFYLVEQLYKKIVCFNFYDTLFLFESVVGETSPRVAPISKA